MVSRSHDLESIIESGSLAGRTLSVFLLVALQFLSSSISSLGFSFFLFVFLVSVCWVERPYQEQLS